MFPSSFAFQPRSAHSPPLFHTSNSHFQSQSADVDFDFDEYDAHRTALEQRALAVKQQERRAAETAALHRHQYKIELDYRQRQQKALYAALAQRQAEEEAYAAAVEQHRRREQARLIAARQAEIEREAYAAQVERRTVAATSAQAQAQALEHRRRRAAQHTADHRESESVHPLQAFLQQLFDQGLDSSLPAQPLDTLAPAPAPTPSSSFDTPARGPAEPVEIAADTAPVSPEAFEEMCSDSEAASTLQRHFRAHLARRAALSSLATLASSLNAQQAAFVAPPALVFQSTSGEVSVIPKLAYSPTNAPFLAHEDFLVNLLTKVDAVQSGGDKVVKTARKELVRRIEQELRRLDERKDVEWEKLRTGENSDAEMRDETTRLPADSTFATNAAAPCPDASPAASIQNFALPPTPPPEPSSPGLIEASVPTQPATNLSSDASTPTPLTPAALAALPSSRPPRTANSDSDSTETRSTLAFDIGDFMDEVIRVAAKLGEQVQGMERAHSGPEVILA